MRDKLLAVYNKLYKQYGPQHWWPGESPWEIAIGAILTQNTNWKNVEKAIFNLKGSGFITSECKKENSAVKLLNADNSVIEKLIKPSGYYRMKTNTLKNFAVWWNENIKENKNINNSDLESMRSSLLNLKGIGPETADSILLYAFNLPTFVIDAYTRRIMARHSETDINIKYEQLRSLFMQNLPEDAQLFNEYHALLVKLAKETCLKKQCKDNCILRF